MRCTLKMIAEKTGVSIMAVSAALNNTTRTRISADKRRYIQQVAKEMGYTPNIVAQSLSGGRTRLIGVVIDSYAQDTCIQVLRGIECHANSNNYRVIVAEQHDSVRDIMEACRTLLNYGVDGIIALAHDYPNQQISEELARESVNMVFWEPSRSSREIYVGTSPEPALKEILSSWCRVGRRNPALIINDTDIVSLRRRVNVYERLCHEYGFEGRVIYSDLLPYDERTQAEMERIFHTIITPEKIDAVMTESDLWGLGIMRAAMQSGCNVPGDLAVVGWDDNSYCSLLTPPLASISLNTEKQGHLLFELLLHKLNNISIDSIEVPAIFRNRESSGF